MKTLLIATKNQGKLKEISQFLSDLQVKVLLSLSDIGIEDEFEEKGKTYKENSQNKAIFYAAKSGLSTIADDGGIEIDALGGAPGIKSRRWLGWQASDEELVEHMKKIARELPKNNRKAYFRTIVSLALPNGKVWSSFGEVEGEISEKPHLKLIKGYPYRSFFYLPKIKKFYHESDLSDKEQKLYNHRYKAITKLKHIIIREMGL